MICMGLLLAAFKLLKLLYGISLLEGSSKCKIIVLLLQIHEIVTTGKLSKLEHFENDEKVILSITCHSF